MAYVPHVDESDWQWWLHQAYVVADQGNPEFGNIQVAQDSAQVLGMKALFLAENDAEAPIWAIARIHNLFGDFRYRAGDFDGARDYWLSALAESDSTTSEFKLEREATLHRLGILNYMHPASNPPSPEQEEANAQFAYTWNATTPGDAASIYRLAQLCEGLTESEQFYKMIRHLVDLHQAYPDSDPRWAVRALVFFAEGASKPFDRQIYAPMDSQYSAISYATDALKLSEQFFGPEDTLTAFVLYRLGDYYDRRGKYTIMDSLWRRAWNIYKRKVVPEHIEYQGGVLRMGGYAFAAGKFVEAEAFAREALRLRSATQGPGHYETGMMWLRLGVVFHATGKYVEADSCYLQALEILEASIQQNESNTATCLRKLGQVQFDRGNYADAEDLFRRAYEMRKRVHGMLHARTAACLNDLAQLYLAWGNLDEAEQYLKEAVVAQTEYLGADHPNIAASLDLLAEIQLANGFLDAAESTLASAVSVRNGLPDLYAVEQADHLKLVAELKGLRGDTDGRDRLLAASLSKAATVYTDSDPRLVPYLVRLARHKMDSEHLSSAEILVNRALAIRQTSELNLHPNFADALECHALLLFRSGQLDSAVRVGHNALELHLRSFAASANVMPEREALIHKRSLLGCRDRLLAAYLNCEAPDNVSASNFLFTILSTKGAVSDLISKRQKRAHLTDAPRCAPLHDTLLSLRALTWRLYNQGSSNAEGSIAPELTNVLEQTHILERELIRKCEATDRTSMGVHPSYDELQSRLGPHDCLVEFIHYQHDSGPRFVALCLKSNGTIKAVELGDAEDIEELVGRYRKHMLRLAEAGAPPSFADLSHYDEIATDLRNRLWSPLKPLLAGAERVLIVPDAAINLISFAGLPMPDGSYLIESYEIHYLTSILTLLQSDDADVRGSGLLALGDPDFDASVSQRVETVREWKVEEEPLTAHVPIRNVRSACEELHSIEVTRLPCTARELNQVAKYWAEQSAEPMWILSGASATEDAFKTRSGGARVIHLATHGYYAMGECRTTTQNRSVLHERVAYENPLLLSGIYLAGANLHGDGTDEAGLEDGILTAAEVAGLNLSSTQIVVLSSCESGVGDVRAGEGVYDLRRAFTQAGAGTVVSALWPVSDHETASFIGALYASANETLSAAMRRAALERLADLRQRRQPDHPLEWAGFIASGRWEGLSLVR